MYTEYRSASAQLSVLACIAICFENQEMIRTVKCMSLSQEHGSKKTMLGNVCNQMCIIQ